MQYLKSLSAQGHAQLGNVRSFFAIRALGGAASSVFLAATLAACTPQNDAAPFTASVSVSGSSADSAAVSGSGGSGAVSGSASAVLPSTGATTVSSGSAGSSAAGSSASAGSSAATFSAVLAVFDAQNCATCHTLMASASNGGLMFNPKDQASAYTALVGVTVAASSSYSMCAGKTYVTKGAPDTSLLYDKIANDTPACGARMPLGAKLTAAQIETVRAWIAAGAAND